jgi:hypothetical protein
MTTGDAIAGAIQKSSFQHRPAIRVQAMALP